jgi:hypothetical protein
VGYDVFRQPAEYASAEASRRARTVFIAFGGYVVLVLGWTALALTGHVSPWSTLFIPLGALAVKPTADAYVDRQLNWQRGAVAERAVGEVLNQLRYEGWIVMHDVEQAHEGNIDHLLSGPGGVFMIETKLRRYEDAHLTKAKRQAAKLYSELGVWVTPVIALCERKKPSPFRTKGVWVVPRQSLLQWVREQHNPAVEFERLARFADRL